jgi:hypothetical protein
MGFKGDIRQWQNFCGLAVPLPPCADRGPEVVEKIDKNKGSLKAVLGSL